MPLAPQELRTFFVISVTQGRRAILQSAPMAELLIAVMAENREKKRFLLHEFVIMPDHIHLLLTPAETVSLEKAVQYIKGGFSLRAKREIPFHGEIWEASFTNHRIREAQDYARHREYIRMNPVTRHLVETAELFPYSSAHSRASFDPAPPWLKPGS
jgi:REP-associated tyrosine transposase